MKENTSKHGEDFWQFFVMQDEKKEEPTVRCYFEALEICNEKFKIQGEKKGDPSAPPAYINTRNSD